MSKGGEAISSFLKDKKVIAFLILAILIIFLVYAVWPFISALFGALIVFILLKPINSWMTKKLKLNKHLAAWILVITLLVIILLASIFLVQGVIKQASRIPRELSNMTVFEETINRYLPPSIHFDQSDIINTIVPFIKNSMSSLFSDIFITFILLFLFYFVLYYLLINQEEVLKKMAEIVPFNEKNSKKVVDEFINITYATLIGTLLIAFVQGGLLWIGFRIVGFPGAFFWGFVTAILSIMPIIGSPVVWIPGCIILLIQARIGAFIFLLILGLFISTIDNFIRPYTNEKFGRIHPVVSIIGLFIGIAQFGFIGIFIGPLLVSYLVLFWKMFKEEYLNS